MGLGLGTETKLSRRDGGDTRVDPSVTILALDTSAHLALDHTPSIFVRTHVVAFLDHDVAGIRRSAALTAEAFTERKQYTLVAPHLLVWWKAYSSDC